MCTLFWNFRLTIMYSTSMVDRLRQQSPNPNTPLICISNSSDKQLFLEDFSTKLIKQTVNFHLVFFSKLLHMQPMHASRNKRGRKLENKNRIGARSLQTPWLRCKSSTDFKRKCRLQAVHWFTANFENEPHSSLLQFNQSLVFFPYVNFDSLRKHPFLFALRRCGHFARKRPQRRRARRNGCFRRLKL